MAQKKRFKTLIFKKGKGFAHPMELNHNQFVWGLASDIPMIMMNETTIEGLKKLYPLDFSKVEIKKVELKIL